MVEIFDFDKFPRNMRFYGGASEQKYGITINEEDYILKFPQNIKGFKLEFPASYSTNAFSEYIGSHFYEYMGLPVHKTLLGTSGKHVAVACKDFCKDDYFLYEFSKIANAYMGQKNLPSPSKVSGDRGVVLTNVLEIIDGVPHLAEIRDALKKRFWDMFVIDSLIANPDRNSGNWGILVPIRERRMTSAELAPVFDNGNSLNAKLVDDAIEKHFSKSDKERIEAHLKTVSIFQRIDDKGEPHKINPYLFCLRHENPDCDAALLRLKDRIPSAIEKVSQLIDGIPLLTDSRKAFYKESIMCRYKYGLSKAIEGLLELKDETKVKSDEKRVQRKDKGGYYR